MQITSTLSFAQGLMAVDQIDKFEIVSWLVKDGTEWGVILHLKNGSHRHLMTARDQIKHYRTLDSAYADILRIDTQARRRVHISGAWIRAERIGAMIAGVDAQANEAERASIRAALLKAHQTAQQEENDNGIPY